MITPEQKQRLKEVEENRRIWHSNMGQVTKDIDFLLSLVKSQEAERDPEVERVAIAGIQEGLRQRDELAANRMRSACVEKVREIGDEVLAEFAAEFKPDGRSFSVLKREAVIKFLRKLKPALESLSIEKPKE